MDVQVKLTEGIETEAQFSWKLEVAIGVALEG